MEAESFLYVYCPLKKKKTGFKAATQTTSLFSLEETE